MGVQASAKEYAKAFRFAIVPGGWEAARDTILRLGGWDKLPRIGVQRVRSEPGGRCELQHGIALGKGEETLEEMLGKADHALVVFLLNPQGEPVRGYAVRWEREEWLPLDLDAQADEVACERVVLGGCTYEELEQWQ